MSPVDRSRHLQRKRDPPSSTPSAPHQRQVLADDVRVGARIGRLGVEEARQRLAQMLARKANHPLRPAARANTADFEQPLQVDRRVVPRRAAAGAIVRSNAATLLRGSTGIAAVESVHELQHRRVPGIDQPVDCARRDIWRAAPRPQESRG